MVTLPDILMWVYECSSTQVRICDCCSNSIAFSQRFCGRKLVAWVFIGPSGSCFHVETIHSSDPVHHPYMAPLWTLSCAHASCLWDSWLPVSEHDSSLPVRRDLWRHRAFQGNTASQLSCTQSSDHLSKLLQVWRRSLSTRWRHQWRKGQWKSKQHLQRSLQVLV